MPAFSIACALFYFPYVLSPLFTALTKTAEVYTHSSHSGTHLHPSCLALSSSPRNLGALCVSALSFSSFLSASPSMAKSFIINTSTASHKCSFQKTYRIPKSFRINTYKKTGGRHHALVHCSFITGVRYAAHLFSLTYRLQ